MATKLRGSLVLVVEAAGVSAPAVSAPAAAQLVPASRAPPAAAPAPVAATLLLVVPIGVKLPDIGDFRSRSDRGDGQG